MSAHRNSGKFQTPLQGWQPRVNWREVALSSSQSRQLILTRGVERVCCSASSALISELTTYQLQMFKLCTDD